MTVKVCLDCILKSSDTTLCPSINPISETRSIALDVFNLIFATLIKTRVRTNIKATCGRVEKTQTIDTKIPDSKCSEALVELKSLFVRKNVNKIH